MADASLFDLDTLENLKTLLGEKFEQLVSAFILDSEGRFKRLESALPERDLKIIRDEAHGVKGSARNIGANSLADICAEIEDQARAGKFEGVEQKVAAAELAFAAVSKELLALSP